MSESQQEIVRADVAEQEPETTEKPELTPEQQGEILSHKRRVALVAYLAVLFAVAFLLVALSMIIENKQLQNSKKELEDKNSRNTATLNGTIAELQNEYDQMKKFSQEQQIKLDSLNTELNAAKAEQESQAALIEEMSAEAESREALQESMAAELEELQTQNESMAAELEELTDRADKTAEAHELVYKAVEADEHGRYDELEELLAQIEPLADLLSPTAKEIYESLAID